jgi:lipoprotein-anchoring transpeptidase ErfK/SrfK
MRQKSFILVAAFIAVSLAGIVALYVYDSSNDDRIAEGVTVGGVDVGGMDTAKARAIVEREVAEPLRKPIRVKYGKASFNLSAQDAKLRPDVGGMVDEALQRSRDGNIFGRTLRDLTGGDEKDGRVEARISYSRTAIAGLVHRVEKGLNRPAQDATLNFPSLTKVKERDGVKVQSGLLERRILSALRDPLGNHEVRVPASLTHPKVTRDQLAKKYPVLIVVDRGAFKLTLYKHLQRQKSYRIAVGQVGLETPAGMYAIQNKAVNAPWSVPNSPWAGSLAGTVIPGGAPNNPLKARWMGIFAGAGIHGTDQIYSLGTAASHGCIRMAIPDVIELYDQVEVKTPVYVA